MPQGNPRSGEKYLHFKNKLYQIVTIAEHSETGEKLVIYQALYGDFGIYARPFDLFTSEVDKVKYPNVEQKYRFLLVEEQNILLVQNEQKVTKEMEELGEKNFDEKEQKESLEKDFSSIQRGREKDFNKLLMDFYDARDYQKKYEILLLMEDGITDIMINNMAVVLDVVIGDGDIQQRYQELKKCLRTYQKYELPRM